jgi:hypothetical protein
MLGLAPLACVSGVHPSRLSASRIEAVAEAHASDDVFAIRLNPAPCEVPPFEILLDEIWHRAFLEPTDPDGPVEAARIALETAGAPPRLSVQGRLSKGSRRAPTRAPCLVLKVLRVCPTEGCGGK